MKNHYVLFGRETIDKISTKLTLARVSKKSRRLVKKPALMARDDETTGLDYASRLKVWSDSKSGQTSVASAPFWKLRTMPSSALGLIGTMAVPEVDRD